MTTTVRALGAAIIALLAASAITVATRDTSTTPTAGEPQPGSTLSTSPATPTAQGSPVAPTPTPTLPQQQTQSPSPQASPRNTNLDGPQDILPRTGSGAPEAGFLLLLLSAIGVLGVRMSLRSRRAR